MPSDPSSKPGSERFTCSPEEAALDMDVDPKPGYEAPLRPSFAPPGMSDEEVARHVYIPPHRRDPSVPYVGPELD